MMNYSQDDLEELLEHDPESLVEIAKAQKDLRKSILERLLEGEYFELAYEINPKKTTPLFIEQDPAGAFIYGIKKDSYTLMHRSMQKLCKDCVIGSEEIYEAYLEIGDTDAFRELLGKLSNKGVQDFPEDYFGEIVYTALERNDLYTLSKIAQVTNDLDGCEKWFLAKKVGNERLAEDLEEIFEEDVEDIVEDLGLVPPDQLHEIKRYRGILTTAYDLIHQVSQHFGTELPKKIIPGGPEGSYATIRYKKFGGTQHAYGIKSSA